ncbi:GDSL-type esterase/lipase family protein [Actinoplanes sp. NPDC049802]|uniref:SGNH/GDSL hydrolase family protein n=1 Tax=Actinoplanes sp. NPDC049802 TaxID=3154742 RepID=UPI0033D4C4EE
MTKPSTTEDVIRDGRRSGTRTLVVCAGDSITHGVMSSDYVAMLADRLEPRGYQFVNAGVSGDLAWNLLRRLDPVVACEPDVVTVLIGSNDVAAHIGERWLAAYMRDQKPPQTPTIDWYRENLTAIVRRLRTETSAEVVLLEMPPLGEDVDSVHNMRIGEYNRVVAEVAAEFGLTVLPLYGRFAGMLPSPAPRPFDGGRGLMYRAIAAHLLLRRSWNRISERNGLTLYTDQLHLNDRAGAVLAEMIAEHLTSR